MSTIGYVVRGLPWAYGRLYRTLNKYTLSAVPLLGGFIVFWLVPGVPVYDAIQSLRCGEEPKKSSIFDLVKLWTFATIVVLWVLWRTTGR